MRHNKLALYIHLIWSTWDRAPLIMPDIERALYRAMEQEANRMNCKVLAMGGVEDHVHLLLEVPPTVALSNVVKQIKGASSLFVNDVLRPDHGFKWQAAPGAFSVSRWDVKQTVAYIQSQKEHHHAGTIVPHLEMANA